MCSPPPSLPAGKLLAFDTTAAGAVKWHEADAKEVAAGGSSEGAGARKPLTVKIPPWSGKWVVGMDSYAPGERG